MYFRVGVIYSLKTEQPSKRADFRLFFAVKIIFGVKRIKFGGVWGEVLSCRDRRTRRSFLQIAQKAIKIFFKNFIETY